VALFEFPPLGSNCHQVLACLGFTGISCHWICLPSVVSPSSPLRVPFLTTSFPPPYLPHFPFFHLSSPLLWHVVSSWWRYMSSMGSMCGVSMPLPCQYSHHCHCWHYHYCCCRHRYHQLSSNLHRTHLAVTVLESLLPMLNPLCGGSIISSGFLVLLLGYVAFIMVVEEWVVGAVWD